MNRRDLLTSVPVAAAGLLTSAYRPAAAAGTADGVKRVRKLEAFGLQLSTVTPLLMADFEGTLAQVAALGYRQVEFSALGFLGRPVSYVAEMLDRLGLAAPVGRVSPKLPENFSTLDRAAQMQAFREYAGPQHLLDNVRHALQAAQALGQRQMVLPLLMAENFASVAQLERSAALLREAGELCAAAGVQFGYHNHDWEFRAVDGVVPYDYLLENVSADLLAFQLDVYWMVKAGVDPEAYLKAYPQRFPTCHLKDIDAGGDFADVGDGRIDFPAFVAAAMAAGTRYYFVERDNPPRPMETAQRGYAYLQQMTYEAL